jgi:phosphonate transport system substrate-binding protein
MNVKRFFASALMLLFLLAGVPAYAEQTKQEVITFGIVPQQSANELAATWGPILTELSKQTGLDVRFATAPNIPTFEKRLAEQKYDIAYMNPYHYAMFSQSAGYKAVAKQMEKQIQGIITVRKDSPITSIEQLKGERIAFPAPLAFAATLIPTANFKARNIAIEPVFVKSHDSVYLNVSKGFFKAGGGIVRTLNNTDAEVQDTLRILWMSQGYTPHAVAVSPKLSDKSVQALAEALFAIKDPDLLKAIGFNHPFGPASDAQWDMIRELDIKIAP